MGNGQIERIDGSEKYFNCTETQRLVFEAGIKLGTIYHQFTGTPLSKDSVADLEKAIEGAISVQPYVEEIQVKIDWSQRSEKDVPKVVTYTSLTGNMIDATVTLTDGKQRVVARMRLVDELNYPLMYIESVEDV